MIARESLVVRRKSLLGNRKGTRPSCVRSLGLMLTFPKNRARFCLRRPAASDSRLTIHDSRLVAHDSRFTNHEIQPSSGDRASLPPERCGRNV